MAIALVQSVLSSNGGPPIVASMASSGTGNLISVMCILGGTATITGIVDNAAGGSNTYQAVPGAYVTNVAVGSTDIWYAKNSRPGATTLTITISTPVGGSTMVAEYSGVSTGSVIDDGENLFLGGGNTKVGPVLTTTKTGDLLVAFVNCSAVVPTGVTSPWSLIPGDVNCEYAHYINTGAPGTYQALFTPHQTDATVTSGAAFIPPQSSSTGGPKTGMLMSEV